MTLTMTWPVEPPLDRLPDRDTVSAWHEAGHAVVALALGHRVLRVAIASDGYTGHCRHEGPDPGGLAATDPARLEACRQGGAIAAAGAVATNGMRQRAGIPYVSIHERLSRGDAQHYHWYEALSGEPPKAFRDACLRLAVETLQEHRPALLAIIEALRERRTLDRDEILVIWRGVRPETTRRVA